MKTTAYFCLTVTIFTLIKAFKEEVICENKSMNITCTSESCGDMHIYVLYGNYGRKNNETCEHNSIENTNCTSGETKIREICHCKESCTLEANNTIFDDPCEGTYKYVEIMYLCVTSKSETDCEDTDKDNVTTCGEPTTTQEQTTMLSASTVLSTSDIDVSMSMPSATTQVVKLESGTLSALEWAGIGIGVLFFLTATVVGGIIVMKRQRKKTQTTTGFQNNLCAMNNKSVSNIELVDNKTGITPSSSITPNGNANLNENETEYDFADMYNCSEMTVNILYDSHQPSSESDAHNAIRSNECIYAQPNKKKKTYENVSIAQGNAMYDVAANLSQTEEATYNELFKHS